MAGKGTGVLNIVRRWLEDEHLEKKKVKLDTSGWALESPGREPARPYNDALRQPIRSLNFRSGREPARPYTYMIAQEVRQQTRH